MEKQWIEYLRKRFADRRVPPPDGLWQDIEAAMSAKGSARRAHVVDGRRGRIVVWLPRVAVAAACFAMLFGVGWMLMRNGNDGSGLPGGVNRNVGVFRSKDVSYAAGMPGQKNAADFSTSVSRHSVRNVVEVCSVGDSVPAVLGAVTVTGEYENVDSIQASDLNDEVENTVSVVVNDKYSRGNQNMRKRGKSLTSASYGAADGQVAKVDVAVFGGGIASLGSSSGTGGVGLIAANTLQSNVAYSSIDPQFRLSSSAFANVTEAAEVKVRHRQPVRLGMSVRFGLVGRLSLETGAFYSYLSSDITSGDESGGFDTDQKLHFVGVPLSVNYNIWSKGKLDVYASLGGAVEFCVSGKSHTDFISGNVVAGSVDGDLRDRRPQWSVDASAGVQYNFSDSFGLYVEPGVGYYFDNGSNVKTIYKEKPFNFNLNVGFRLTVR